MRNLLVITGRPCKTSEVVIASASHNYEHPLHIEDHPFAYGQAMAGLGSFIIRAANRTDTERINPG